MKAEKKLKKFNETQYKQELKQLEVLKNLLAEKIDLLNQLDSKTIVDFETKKGRYFEFLKNDFIENAVDC